MSNINIISSATDMYYFSQIHISNPHNLDLPPLRTDLKFISEYF